MTDTYGRLVLQPPKIHCNIDRLLTVVTPELHSLVLGHEKVMYHGPLADAVRPEHNDLMRR